MTNANGHRVTYEHDVAGQLDIVRDRRGNATAYHYDDDGNVLRTTDPLGHVTTSTSTPVATCSR